MRIGFLVLITSIYSISFCQEWRAFTEFEILSIQMGLSPSQMKVDPSTNDIWFTTGTRLHHLGEGVSEHITFTDHSITGLIDFIEVKNGKVWMITANSVSTGSLYSYNGSIVNHEVDLGVHAYTIEFDNEDTLWIGSDDTDGIGVHAFKDGGFVAYDDMNSPVIDLNIYQVLEDSYDRKWVVYESSPSIRLWDMNTGTSELYSYFLGHNLTQFIQINKVVQAPSGTIWIASSDGIFKFDEVDEDWISYNTANSNMPINEVTDIQFDQTGKMWALFKDTALAYSYNMTDWTVFDSNNSDLRFLGGFQGIRSFTIDTLNNVWTADDDYVYVFNSDGVEGWANTDELNETTKLNLYPNPANNEIIIEGVDISLSMEIYTVLGEQVQNHQLNSGKESFSLDALNVGTYIVVFKDHNGTIIDRRRLIKQ